MLSMYKKVFKVFSGHGIGKFGIGKFYPIRVAHSFILSHLKSTFAEVDGHKMFPDSKDSLNLSINGIYEPLKRRL